MRDFSNPEFLLKVLSIFHKNLEKNLHQRVRRCSRLSDQRSEDDSSDLILMLPQKVLTKRKAMIKTSIDLTEVRLLLGTDLEEKLHSREMIHDKSARSRSSDEPS